MACSAGEVRAPAGTVGEGGDTSGGGGATGVLLALAETASETELPLLSILSDAALRTRGFSRSAVSHSPSHITSMRRTSFCNSRTLPGQL